MLAAQQWENCKEALLSGDDNLIVLDEMTYAMQFGWISTSDVFY